MRDIVLLLVGFSVGLFLCLMNGCTSGVIRNGDCEASYTRFFGAVDGLQGGVCGAAVKVDSAKVDSDGISATAGAVTTPLKVMAVGNAVEAVAPVAGALIAK